MGMLQEFKKFALRGNVIDMAVGIIIGAAFTTVVKSLVDDVIMPPIGYISTDVDFRNLSWELKPAVKNEDGSVAKPAVTLNYGAFINNCISFIIVAWAAFFLVKAVNIADARLRFGELPAEDKPLPPEDILLLREIRDSLKRT